MNHSIYSADRATHLKIVVVGLLCAVLVAAIGTFAHVSDVDLGTTQLVKAGQPTAVTGRLPTSANIQFVRQRQKGRHELCPHMSPAPHAMTASRS